MLDPRSEQPLVGSERLVEIVDGHSEVVNPQGLHGPDASRRRRAPVAESQPAPRVILRSVQAAEHHLELDGELLDLDLVEHTWIGLTRLGDGTQQLLFGDDSSVVSPRIFRFPIVRAVGTGHALLAEARIERDDEPNGYLVAASGTVEGLFRFGDGIQDVLVSPNEVVVTYFDEGVFSSATGETPAGEGVAVFDFSGALRGGFNSSRSDDDVFIADCYSATWSNGGLLVCPYTADEPNFPIIVFDVRSLTHELLPTPEALHGSHALAAAWTEETRVALFHGPYEDKSGIYRWRIGDDEHERIGQHAGPLRGLRGARFLAHSASAYTVLTPDEAV
jgi:hypothetical protein